MTRHCTLVVLRMWSHACVCVCLFAGAFLQRSVRATRPLARHSALCLPLVGDLHTCRPLLPHTRTHTHTHTPDEPCEDFIWLCCMQHHCLMFMFTALNARISLAVFTWAYAQLSFSLSFSFTHTHSLFLSYTHTHDNIACALYLNKMCVCTLSCAGTYSDLSDSALESAVRSHLSQWFGKSELDTWKLIRIYRIPFAQPNQVSSGGTQDMLFAHARRHTHAHSHTYQTFRCPIVSLDGPGVTHQGGAWKQWCISCTFQNQLHIIVSCGRYSLYAGASHQFLQACITGRVTLRGRGPQRQRHVRRSVGQRPQGS